MKRFISHNFSHCSSLCLLCLSVFSAFRFLSLYCTDLVFFYSKQTLVCGLRPYHQQPPISLLLIQLVVAASRRSPRRSPVSASRPGALFFITCWLRTLLSVRVIECCGHPRERPSLWGQFLSVFSENRCSRSLSGYPSKVKTKKKVEQKKLT